MMDADLPKTSENLDILTSFAQRTIDDLDYEGKLLLLESTQSYHILGTQTLDLQDILRFLAINSLASVQSPDGNQTLINESGCADGSPLKGFAAWTLLKDFDNGLRITNSAQRPQTPKVVKVVSKSMAGSS
ncbi:MAG: hypothetical protein ACR2LN_06160 [Candidatus Levyibacteriota bacterium]